MVESTTNGKLATSTCGDYNIVRTLGHGGNAVVKLVEKDGTRYAMKIMVFTGDEKEKANFIKSIQEKFDLVKDLNHKSIVKYHEFNDNTTWTKKSGEKIPCCYLLLELLEGVELLELMNVMGDVEDPFYRYIFIEIANSIH